MLLLSIYLSALVARLRAVVRLLRHPSKLFFHYSHDCVHTRAERTKRGIVEVCGYEDGSGFEVAMFGSVFIFGAE